MTTTENNLVFPTTLLREIGYFQGLNFNYKPYLERIFSAGVSFFVSDRDGVEDDPTKKQIIPYIIIEANGKLLFYIRSKQHGEIRLAEKGSIGIGGHIAETDAIACHKKSPTMRDIYNAGAIREANEELEIKTQYENKIVAVLNDDRNAVGQVHFGVVHLWRLKEPHVQKKDAEIAQLDFLYPHEIESYRKILESWSQICLDSIDKIMAQY